MSEASETEAAETEPTPRRRRFGRSRTIAFIVAIVALLALIGAWVSRKPIAEGFIDRELAKAGVPARYAIADLRLGGQRLTNVIIGDPAHPDLVADWIETRTGVGLSGPYLQGVRAGHVRLRGRLIDGIVSFGSIDRLLPAPSGKPFALPAIDVEVADARMRLEMPQGLVGMALSGSGRLDDGFHGRMAAVGERLAVGGCTIDRLAAAVDLRVDAARPHVIGPVTAARIACAGLSVAMPRTDLDLALDAAFDRWRGQATLATGVVVSSAATLAGVRGTLAFEGTRARTGGTVDLTGEGVRSAQGTARQATVAGTYAIGDGTAFDGRVRVGGGAVAPASLARASGWGDAAAGTPVGPLATAIARSVGAAGRDLSGEAAVALRMTAGQGRFVVSHLALASASGASVALRGGSGVTVGWPKRDVRLDTMLVTRGGGLPDARVSLAQTGPGAPIRGVARIAPYAAGGARLALDPVTFSATMRGATRIATRAVLSGPLGDGRIDDLTLPIRADWDGRGRLVVDADCTPMAFRRLAVSGLALDATRLSLCPVDGALLRIEGGRMSGGMHIAAAHLGGRLGSTPVVLAATGTTVRLADRGFAVEGVRTRIGTPDRMTRLDFAAIDGRIGAGVLGGRFTGGAGQIANVPLLLAGANGDWTFKAGTLGLTGAMTVSDAVTASPRFKPLQVKDVTLALVGGTIRANGVLREPATAAKVADVTIVHALGTGAGSADLKVQGIAFTETLQPDALTPLTFGVIADVRGNVSGAGHIAWTADGVTSTGRFTTANIDLAAAFGPATGIATTIRFTDLLNLQSAPGQVATVKSINPGIPVTDGTIHYQTLPGARVQVEDGRWPFAGGALTLDPTLLDFSAPRERRMTFHVAGMAADQFLQQFDFKNLDATGIFDGVLPMVFDADGGVIRGGHLTVRPGGGTIAYVGDITQKDVGLWGNLAFQALRSLRFRNLEVVMNGPLAGEMVTAVKFAGISQGAGAKSNFLIRRLQRLPFVFNIRIKAPFRGLLDSAQSFYDPKRLIERNLPSLLEEQNKRAAPPLPPTSPIQPPASRIVP